MTEAEVWDQVVAEYPHCVKTLSAWIDWLQESGDPRWGPYTLLLDRCKNGFPTHGKWYEAKKHLGR